MPRFAALLRGIAPSGTNMTNDKLRAVFEGLGFSDVASVLASGIIVFRSDEEDAPFLERRIEEALGRELGLSSRTLVRSSGELRVLVHSNPFPGLTHGPDTYLTATFIQDAGGAPAISAGQLDAGTTVVRYDPAARAVLAITDNRTPGAARGFTVWLERSFGKGITTRSWLTVQRITRMLES